MLTAPQIPHHRLQPASRAADADKPRLRQIATPLARMGTRGTRNRAGGLNPPRHIGQTLAVAITPDTAMSPAIASARCNLHRRATPTIDSTKIGAYTNSPNS